jgi:hypothetical protein
MIKIEKAVPMDDGGRNKYPFAHMEVGDSFFLAGVKARALSNASQWHAKRLGRQFRAKTCEGGARVWRTA